VSPVAALLPLWVLASSLVPAIVIFFLPEEWRRRRTALNVSAAVLKLGLTAAMAWLVFQGHQVEVRLPLVAGADLSLRASSLGLLFVTLSALLWLATTIYAVGYLEGAPDRSRFFGFFSLCVSATMGIALAGNLLTFFIFYELLTLSTYPLVVHRGTPAALRAGDTYLRYTLFGGVLLLGGIALLYTIAGTLEFTEGGALGPLTAEHRGRLRLAFALLVAGLGVKAALIPLHGWLPIAMVAPAPVSALLHAVAVVKAGAFGVTRVVYDVYGIRVAEELALTRPLAIFAAATVLYGSLRALGQADLKRRLAFSTVSQVSYIVLGVAVVGSMATIGGLVHLVHQGLMKITLFFCAGNLAEELGIHRVDELRGVGRRMPLTMAAFTIAALGMIGLPPIAGFVSKWYLGLGAMQAGAPWVVGVLLASSALNAAYFLPLIHRAWFMAPAHAWPPRRAGRPETGWLILLPTLAVAGLALGVGLVAAWELSPLGWAKLIADRELVP
jgi:multicomponent Na+:H+ antiporter subunit D